MWRSCLTGCFLPPYTIVCSYAIVPSPAKADVAVKVALLTPNGPMPGLQYHQVSPQSGLMLGFASPGVWNVAKLLIVNQTKFQLFVLIILKQKEQGSSEWVCMWLFRFLTPDVVPWNFLDFNKFSECEAILAYAVQLGCKNFLHKSGRVPSCPSSLKATSTLMILY